MTGAVRTFVSRCSLVVRPISLWTGRPPTGSALIVRLKELAKPPIRTTDGCYAFLDYPGRKCTLTMLSPYYLPVEMPLDLDSFEQEVPIVDVEMRPGRLYPPPAAAAGFRFRVLDAGGLPLKGVDVNASISGKGKTAGDIRVSTWSDNDGFVVLPLRGQLPQTCTANVEFAFGGRKSQVEWKVESGTVAEMPDVRLGK